jgi:hypothetical protein
MRFLFLDRCPACEGPVYFEPDPPGLIFCGDKSGCGWSHKIGMKQLGGEHEEDSSVETSGSDDPEAAQAPLAEQ